jgi:hypothetical protein
MLIIIALLSQSALYALDMPERPTRDKSFFISVNSITKLNFFGLEDTTYDTSTSYETKSDKFQSLSLDLYQGEERRLGISSNIDLFSIGANDFDLKVRNQIFYGALRDAGFLKSLILGRQNTYTGFNFYKIDGLSTTLALGKDIQLSGFAGIQPDSTLSFELGGLDDITGFVKLNYNFGYRSHAALHYNYALLNDSTVANDLGLDIIYNILRRLALKAKALASFGDETGLSEAQLRAQYRISRMHHPYLGYTLHNPIFRNPMTIYFYDLFNYHKVYGGWRFKPFKKIYIYFIGEYGIMLINDLLIHNAKLSFLSPYFDILYVQRFGDLNEAGMLDISAKWPVHRMLTIGAGFNYINMESIYEKKASLFNYGGFIRFTPFKEIMLQTRLENRSDYIYDHDLRFLLELRIGYCNKHGDLFRKKDSKKE